MLPSSGIACKSKRFGILLTAVVCDMPARFFIKKIKALVVLECDFAEHHLVSEQFLNGTCVMSCAVTVWGRIKNSLGVRHRVTKSYVEDDDGIVH